MTWDEWFDAVQPISDEAAGEELMAVIDQETGEVSTIIGIIRERDEVGHITIWIKTVRS